MDASHYRRQPTWACATNDEPEQENLADLVRGFLERRKRRTEEIPQQESRLGITLKALAKSMEDCRERSDMISTQISMLAAYVNNEPIAEEEKEEAAAEAPQSSAEFIQYKSSEPSCSRSSDTMAMLPHQRPPSEKPKSPKFFGMLRRERRKGPMLKAMQWKPYFKEFMKQVVGPKEA